MKKIVLLLIIILFFAASVSVGAKKTKKVYKPKQTAKKAAVKKAVKEPAKLVQKLNEGKINIWLSNGIAKLLVDNFERSQTYDIYEAPDNMSEFVIFSIKQQNATDETQNIGIDIEGSYLEDIGGHTYPPYLWNEEKKKALEPGGLFSSEIIFVVQKETTLKVLVLKTVDDSQKSFRVNF